MCLLRNTSRPCIVYSNCFSLTKSASGVFKELASSVL